MATTHQQAEKCLSLLSSAENLLTTFAFIILTGTMFLDVLSREITGVGLHWARQVSVYANIFVVMLGLGVASASGAHLRPRFADNWLPAHWEPYLKRMQDLLMSLFCLVAGFFAAQVTLESAFLGEVSSLLPVVIWPILAVIPIAFILAAIRHAIYAVFPELSPIDPITAQAEKK